MTGNMWLWNLGRRILLYYICRYLLPIDKLISNSSVFGIGHAPDGVGLILALFFLEIIKFPSWF